MSIPPMKALTILALLLTVLVPTGTAGAHSGDPTKKCDFGPPSVTATTVIVSARNNHNGASKVCGNTLTVVCGSHPTSPWLTEHRSDYATVGGGGHHVMGVACSFSTYMPYVVGYWYYGTHYSSGGCQQC